MSKLLWIIQDGFYDDANHMGFIEALKRMESDYIIVSYTKEPETLELVESNLDWDANNLKNIQRQVCFIGGYSLARMAKKYGWNPGTFANDNFNYQAWIDGYGAENLLNSKLLITTIKKSPDFVSGNSFFVRPIEDTKAFTGRVFTTDEFVEFKRKVMTGELYFNTLNPETEIMMSPLAEIYSETRFFVVDKKIITHSFYKRGGQPYFSENVEPFVKDFAIQMVDKWQPSEAFVIDIADTDKGLKIVELNGFNSAGIYESNPFQIIDSIELLLNKE